MWTIETTNVIDEKRTISLRLPDDIPLGEQTLVITLDTKKDVGPKEKKANLWDDCPVRTFEIPWPENMTFRREDMYGDDGR